MESSGRKGRTVEKADVDAGIADAGSQGFSDLGVRVRGILKVSGRINGLVSGKLCVQGVF